MSRILLVLFVLGAALVNAQAPPVSAPGPGLVVGAGNFFHRSIISLVGYPGFGRFITFQM